MQKFFEETKKLPRRELKYEFVELWNNITNIRRNKETPKKGIEILK